MRKYEYFKNRSFKVGLLIFIGLLLLRNFYIFFTGNNQAIIPIIVQFILIVLIIGNNKHIKLVLKIWSGIFLILLPAIQIIAKMLKFLIDTSIGIDNARIIQNVVMVVIGIVIFYFTNKTVEKM